MKTYDEISNCRKANRRYHNASIRFTISCIRYHADLAAKGSDLHQGLLKSYRATLQKKLENRKNFEYLKDSLK